MYQKFAERQEHQEYFDDCVKVAVEAEIKRIINSATCFDCDNPVVAIRTLDGGISVKSCEKCHGTTTEPQANIGKFLFDSLNAMNKGVIMGKRLLRMEPGETKEAFIKRCHNLE